MENMEKITWRIWESDGLAKALLIGGLLFYVPIINLLLLGYLGCWARRLVRREGMDLPEWREGRRILDELIRVLAPFAVWVLLPFVLASFLVWSLSGLMSMMYLALFAKTIAWLPLAAVSLLSPVAFTVALIRLYRTDNIRESVNVQEVLQETLLHMRSCLFPLFQFYGILLIGWPLVGFAMFLATLPLMAQLILIMRDGKEDLNSQG